MALKNHRENNIFTTDKNAGESFNAVENQLEARYGKYKLIIQNFTIMSDTFMRKVFQKRECVGYALQVIMKKPDLQVREHVVQGDYKNLQGRSAILDCVAYDTDGRQYNIEIQQDFEGLPESYVIFITGQDTLGDQLPIYHIRRRIDETGKTFDDKAYLIKIRHSCGTDRTGLKCGGCYGRAMDCRRCSCRKIKYPSDM